ncbi:hypothetical protein [Mesorhizobium amorphae]|uniref:hypothetical protein n=1 Tax=Mesorhizobium amorphae TaxID=71433 RepID=UPI00177F4E7E|nr:hypothetical protein [Mesorhizobium amorphae]
MPNTQVRAAAEGMPAINLSRRLALLGGLSAAAALAAIPRAQAEGHDPLLDAINAYRAGLADFNAYSPEDDDAADAYADQSYGPPMTALGEWEAPATTRAGAMEALRLIAEENSLFVGSPLVEPLLAAALAYFEAQS